MAEEENWFFQSSDDESAHFTQVCMMARVDENADTSSEQSEGDSEVSTSFEKSELVESLMDQIQNMEKEFENLKDKLSTERQSMMSFRDENALLKERNEAYSKIKQLEDLNLKRGHTEQTLNLLTNKLQDVRFYNAKTGLGFEENDVLKKAPENLYNFDKLGSKPKKIPDIHDTFVKAETPKSDISSKANDDTNIPETACQYDDYDSDTDVAIQIPISDSVTSESLKEVKTEECSNIMNPSIQTEFANKMTEEIFDKMMNASDPVPIIEKLDSNSMMNQTSDFEKQIKDLQKTLEELEDENCDLKFKLDKSFEENKEISKEKQQFHELNVKMIWKWVPKPRYEWRIKAKACHLWYIDSGCSRHMTGVKSLLHNYIEEPAGMVSFANSELNGIIIGHDSLKNGTVTIKKVLSVCLLAKASKAESWTWHRRLSHQNFKVIDQLARQGIVKGLPEMRFEKDSLCLTCEMGKMKRSSHKAKTEFSCSTPLELNSHRPLRPNA
ncbi:hypothetical protein L6452_14989 [Arctium lappa]|uniref:Uncharacterized protein n=1 Tax=Arctium lappa TaxID=4217 RepID=A0ACB9CMI0_ARCLA|nr:hypothetical protein L6452_14989 [Arctium lappa]